ncbi:MAG: hypothetical protein ACNYWU_04570 [Desulfobacterales bacterium]
MSNELRVEVRNLAEVNEYLNNMPEETFEDAKPLFSHAVIEADRRVKSLFGARIQSRSGTLRRSLRTGVTGTSLRNLRASFYSAGSVAGKPVPYAPIQEFGGTIEAKRAYTRVPGGPYLNIPTRSNQTSAGVMRKSARTIFNEGGYIQKTRSGKWGVFLGSTMMFVLKKRVHITPKLGMITSSERQIAPLLSSLSRIIGE